MHGEKPSSTQHTQDKAAQMCFLDYPQARVRPHLLIGEGQRSCERAAVALDAGGGGLVADGQRLCAIALLDIRPAALLPQGVGLANEVAAQLRVPEPQQQQRQ